MRKADCCEDFQNFCKEELEKENFFLCKEYDKSGKCLKCKDNTINIEKKCKCIQGYSYDIEDDECVKVKNENFLKSNTLPNSGKKSDFTLNFANQLQKSFNEILNFDFVSSDLMNSYLNGNFTINSLSLNTDTKISDDDHVVLNSFNIDSSNKDNEGSYNTVLNTSKVGDLEKKYNNGSIHLRNLIKTKSSHNIIKKHLKKKYFSNNNRVPFNNNVRKDFNSLERNLENFNEEIHSYQENSNSGLEDENTYVSTRQKPHIHIRKIPEIINQHNVLSHIQPENSLNNKLIPFHSSNTQNNNIINYESVNENLIQDLNIKNEIKNSSVVLKNLSNFHNPNYRELDQSPKLNNGKFLDARFNKNNTFNHALDSNFTNPENIVDSNIIKNNKKEFTIHNTFYLNDDNSLNISESITNFNKSHQLNMYLPGIINNLINVTNYSDYVEINNTHLVNGNTNKICKFYQNISMKNEKSNYKVNKTNHKLLKDHSNYIKLSNHSNKINSSNDKLEKISLGDEDILFNILENENTPIVNERKSYRVKTNKKVNEDEILQKNILKEIEIYEKTKNKLKNKIKIKEKAKKKKKILDKDDLMQNSFLSEINKNKLTFIL